MLTGDTPVIVGKDGPSLGGFRRPGRGHRRRPLEARQLRPGDQLRLMPTTPLVADAAMSARRRLLTDLPGAVAEEFQIQHRRANEP